MPDYSMLNNIFDPCTTGLTQLELPDFTLLDDTFNNILIQETPQTPDYSLLDDTFDNVLNADFLAYGGAPPSYDYHSESPASSVSSNTSPSFAPIHDHESYLDLTTNCLPAPNDIDSPTFGSYPALYTYSSPSTSESSTTSPNTAPGLFDSGFDLISAYPTYSDYSVSQYDDAVNGPWNASSPRDISPPSTSYGSCLNIALGYFCFCGGKLGIDGTCEAQAPDSSFVSQGVDWAPIVPAEDPNTQNNTNPQQTCHEQSVWDINSFCDEGIEPFTKISDHDTGAGPSTGSSVAAAMLDIGQARHGQSRVDRATNVSTAQEERRGNGKRKAMDATDAPESSKRLRLDPSAQSMDDITAAQPVEDPASRLGNFCQKRIRSDFRLILPPETTNGSEGLLSGASPLFMTQKFERKGTFTMRHTVIARDGHN
ncbi:hypothetical protein HYPSUDRAFT_36360 [Hypholoma sublateritium FD-334 SS-4]|uniref:Uncharacterized protein n=1 Tax=Hypholoma sublateritium (strain FD-334 SS-4) TaxID=945553 RepID=A0A0D2Q513_HYPSF|nr:hypothetical protein HYPSUDRAFT_36360 [Hypholoma sublateritium FD-334 SS-4]